MRLGWGWGSGRVVTLLAIHRKSIEMPGKNLFGRNCSVECKVMPREECDVCFQDCNVIFFLQILYPR